MPTQVSGQTAIAGMAKRKKALTCIFKIFYRLLTRETVRVDLYEKVYLVLLAESVCYLSTHIAQGFHAPYITYSIAAVLSVSS